MSASSTHTHHDVHDSGRPPGIVALHSGRPFSLRREDDGKFFYPISWGRYENDEDHERLNWLVVLLILAHVIKGFSISDVFV